MGEEVRTVMPELFEPPGLRDLVNSIEYKPGWEFHMAPFIADGSVRGYAFYVVSQTPDSYNHDRIIRVRHEFIVPPATYNEATWLGWLFDRIRQVEDHEAGEFFIVNGARVFAPHHGNGEDPYRVWFVGDYADTRKKAGED
jgi:hypothetical protein